jgi:hypothetical protein
VRVEQRQAAGDLADGLGEAKDRGRIEVVQDPEGQDDVELTIRLATEVADVVETKLDAVEPQGIARELGARHVTGTRLNADHLSPEPAELQGKDALHAAEVENPEPVERSDQVANRVDRRLEALFLLPDPRPHGVDPWPRWMLKKCHGPTASTTSASRRCRSALATAASAVDSPQWPPVNVR